MINVKNVLSGVCLLLANLAWADTNSSYQRMYETSVNVSATEFLFYLRSQDKQRKDMVNGFLLGVLDSTEGTHWCSYSKFKYTTLRERIYLEMEKMEEKELEARASLVIATILKERFPCDKN